MTKHYRAEYADRSRLPERLQRLNKLMHVLLKTAQTNAVAMVGGHEHDDLHGYRA